MVDSVEVMVARCKGDGGRLQRWKKSSVSGEEEKDTKKKVIFKRFGIKQEVVVVQG